MKLDYTTRQLKEFARQYIESNGEPKERLQWLDYAKNFGVSISRHYRNDVEQSLRNQLNATSVMFVELSLRNGENWINAV